MGCLEGGVVVVSHPTRGVRWGIEGLWLGEKGRLSVDLSQVPKSEAPGAAGVSGAIRNGNDLPLELPCPLDDGADGDSGGPFGDPGLGGFYPGYSGDVEVDPGRVFGEDVEELGGC